MFGAGGDEILSQYKTDHTEMLSEDLSFASPWPEYYFARQRKFLKEETIAGAVGRETRYPFGLTPAVIKSFHERPLHCYMISSYSMGICTHLREGMRDLRR